MNQVVITILLSATFAVPLTVFYRRIAQAVFHEQAALQETGPAGRHLNTATSSQPAEPSRLCAAATEASCEAREREAEALMQAHP